ncbi:MAG: translocation/assembly module TamB [Candidatus Binataceae bacterium]|nr:translocation/assembly module TamB [Candidatus Binataceae bacterium]
MRLVLKLLKWLTIAGIAIVAAVAIGIAIFTGTATFRNLLKTRVNVYIAQTYQGQLSVGKIEGSIWGNLILRDVRLQYRGSEAAFIPVLRAGYGLLPIFGGELDIYSLVAERPTLQLTQGSDGQWNLLQALTPRSPSGGSSSFAIRVGGLKLEHACAEIVPRSGKAIWIREAQLAAALTIGKPGMRFAVKRLTAAIGMPGYPDSTVEGNFTYATVDHPSGAIPELHLALRTRLSSATLDAQASNLGAKQFDATIAVKTLAAADLNLFVANAPLTKNLSGTAHLTANTLKAVDLDLNIAAGQGRIAGRAKADLTATEPIYNATLQLHQLDVHGLIAATIARNIPAGAIDGTVQANGRGKTIAGLEAEANLQDRGLALAGYQFGNLTLEGHFKQKVAALDAKLSSRAGHADLAGKIDINGAAKYNLQLAVKQLELNRMARQKSVPAGKLNLTARVQGVGANPATMAAAVHLICLPSTLGPARIDRGRIDARVANGVLHISDGLFSAKDSILSARGEVTLTGQHRGRLHYTLRSANLQPWLAIAGRPGGGAIAVAGVAAGSPQALRLSGAADFSRIRFERYAVDSGHLTYDVGGIGGPTQAMRGQLTIGLEGVNAGMPLKSFHATVKSRSGRTADVAVTINAVQTATRSLALAGDLVYQPRRTTLRLAALALSTDAGNWRLQNPAVVALAGQSLKISGLELASDDQHVSIEGTVANNGAQQLEAKIERLRLSPIAGLLAQNPGLSGIVSAQIKIAGTAGAPLVRIGAEANDLQLGGIHYQGLSTTLDYAGTRVSIALAFMQDPAHHLDLSGTVPLQLSWIHGFAHQLGGGVDLIASSRGLDLAFLNVLNPGAVKDIKGTLTLNVALHGALRHPEPTGYLALNGGQFLIKPLAVRVNHGNLRLELAPRQIKLVALSADAEDGNLSGKGLVTLSDYAPEQADLTVSLHKWPAIATRQFNATVNGNLSCAGPIDAPNITGQIDVLHGLYRPDLDLLGEKTYKADHTIVVSDSWNQPAPAPGESTQNGNTQSRAGSMFRYVGLQIEVLIGRNNWIKNDQSEVNIDGKLRVSKANHGELGIWGVIHTVQGTLVLVGKTFTVNRGSIRFTGGSQFDPLLDLMGQYSVGRYQIIANLTGLASKPVLTLSSLPTLPQSDILSVLMFGKPASQLTSGQQQGLQQQALSMAAGAATAQLGKSVAQALGVQNLGLTMSNGGLGVGHYLTDNVYVSGSQATTSGQGQSGSVTVYLTPHLNLNTSASTSSQVGNQIELNWQWEY